MGGLGVLGIAYLAVVVLSFHLTTCSALEFIPNHRSPP